MEMEEGVWSRYPEELHMAILIRLPWIDKLRLRRVCVLWNTILRDPSLLKCSRSPTGSLPFCCLSSSHGGEMQLYSSLGRNWHTFRSSMNFRVIAAAAGLLLMEGTTDVKRTIILFNPLNRTQRQLSLPPELEDIALHQSCIFQMTVDKERGTLRILAGVWVVFSDNNTRNLRNWHKWKFHVYNLESDTWNLIADLCMRDEGYPLSTLVQQFPSVTLVGKDLFLLSTFHGTSSHLYKISSAQQLAISAKLGPEQDLVVGGESGAQLPPSSSYVDSKLFESEGRLLMILRQKIRIGKVDDCQNNFWELSVYEFDFLSAEWKVALELPPMLARSRSFVTFDVNAGCVCFHNDDFTGMCNLNSKTWIRLPPRLHKEKNRNATTNIFLFEPRLDIIL